MITSPWFGVRNSLGFAWCTSTACTFAATPTTQQDSVVYEIVPEKAQNPVSPPNPVNTQSPETAQDLVGLQEDLPLPETIDRPEVPNEPVYILPSDEADQDSEIVGLQISTQSKDSEIESPASSYETNGMVQGADATAESCDRGLYFATEFTFLSQVKLPSQVEVADLLSDEDQLIQSKGAFGYGQRAILGLQGSAALRRFTGTWKPGL